MWNEIQKVSLTLKPIIYCFYRPGGPGWTGLKKLISFRDHQQSKCHLAALTFEVPVPQCLDVIALANLLGESKDNRKCMFGNFTEKDL